MLGELDRKTGDSFGGVNPGPISNMSDFCRQFCPRGRCPHFQRDPRKPVLFSTYRYFTYPYR